MKSQEIYYVTSNSGKFDEVKKLIEQNSTVSIKQFSLDIPEYQSLDVNYIIKEKALEAFKQVQKPLLVDDGGIYLKAYNNFPGTLSKFVYQGIGLDGFWKLAYDNPQAYFLACLAYVDSKESITIFEGYCSGVIINPTDKVIDKRLPFADIFIPDGYAKVLNELRQEGVTGFHREQALQKFLDWLKT